MIIGEYTIQYELGLSYWIVGNLFWTPKYTVMADGFWCMINRIYATNGGLLKSRYFRIIVKSTILV